MSKFRGIITLFMSLLYNDTVMDSEESIRTFLTYLNKSNYNFSMTNFSSYFSNINTSEVPKDCCCNGLIKDVSNMYGQVHGYLSLAVCMFGTIANILNIAVLTKKDMACTPVNRILTGLAVADMLVMIEYIPFAYYYYLVFPSNLEHPYSWALYMLFHTNFAQVLHTISICLTLALAIWRYIAIRYPDKNHIFCTENRCSLAISISYILPILLCSPSYFVTAIRRTHITENGQDYLLYHVDLSDFAKNNEYFYISCFWTYSVLIKLLPCVILTVISYWLIQALYTAKKRKQVLRGYNTCPTSVEAPERRSKSERRTERTTKMLIAVLLLFLITEFPQGIMGLLSGILGPQFFLKCYHLMGHFMDILALLNGAINFILYCSMSRQFRQTFGQLFKPKILVKWPHPSQTEIHTTYV